MHSPVIAGINENTISRPFRADQLTAPLPLQPPDRKVTSAEDLANHNPALTTRVAASLLGMSISNLKKMRQRKQGPDYFRTETGSIRYMLSAVLRYRLNRTIRH